MTVLVITVIKMVIAEQSPVLCNLKFVAEAKSVSLEESVAYLKFLSLKGLMCGRV